MKVILSRFDKYLIISGILLMIVGCVLTYYSNANADNWENNVAFVMGALLLPFGMCNIAYPFLVQEVRKIQKERGEI